jgi:hypothetical protein
MTTVGGCLCGALRYRVEGPLDPVGDCHCSQCRRASGHFAAYTGALLEHVAIERDVAWFESTPGEIRRGFCPRCGSQLFWDRIAAPKLDIAAGCLDAPTGVALARHIFVPDNGDYHAIADSLPQHARGSESGA